MMLFRAVRHSDLNGVQSLSQRAGIGLTSFPNNLEQLRSRIARSVDTFEGKLTRAQQGFLFVLEDISVNRVAGVSAIEVAVGLEEPFYNFRVQKTIRSSRELGIYKSIEALTLEQDQTGNSELCTLFLDPEYQKGRNGVFLSKARFLFIAAFRDIFSKIIFAEMRGVADEQGNSPFWNSLGQHFFGIPFSQADYLTGIGSKTFIAELMPLHPIYISLLSAEAQKVIGQVHEKTVPARAILEKEGLIYQDHIDIFDGGALLQAEIDRIRAVKESRLVSVSKAESVTRDDGVPCIVANQQFSEFRALLLNVACDSNELFLTTAEMDALQVSDGEQVRRVSLFPKEN
ncbi:arginine N-succinyltransferase [Photorhabdus bodei]|uniref:Arginine N-succinyltransferase n=1 Tax=Photorhabdus bodei TaxID=2029681 RepID=A0A329XBV5_9GAMM|nr:arginine N-succinyltransferase [Photorhabdus bodei]NDK98982.1 arginine N-succinyltransferase [Photorhabdus bodei]NDL03326.1 arginine N-succinyltransferase [Photorhabdus bodei]NDL07440.1 arginine N-succinyltransferase [Photorhabdus bodei]RAX14066.1 arginine N-succinyltransferase [Photorhabdus bodei]